MHAGRAAYVQTSIASIKPHEEDVDIRGCGYNVFTTHKWHTNEIMDGPGASLQKHGFQNEFNPTNDAI